MAIAAKTLTGIFSAGGARRLPCRSLNYRGGLWNHVGNGRGKYRENNPVR